MESIENLLSHCLRFTDHLNVSCNLRGLFTLGSCLLPGQRFRAHPSSLSLYFVARFAEEDGQLTPMTDGPSVRLCLFFLPLLSLRGFNQARSIHRHGPGFNAWPFLDSIRATNNAHTHAFVLNFKEDGSGLDRLESFHYYRGKNGRLGESILNAEGTPSERVCIPILPMTKARPDHPNLPLG